MHDAVNRRLFEELEMRSELHFLYKFGYHASFEGFGSEREMCSVFLGQSSDPPRPNPHESSQWRWIAPDQLDEDMESRPDSFTPWFRKEWPHVRTAFGRLLGIEDLG